MLLMYLTHNKLNYNKIFTIGWHHWHGWKNIKN